ncbi:MAG: flagellar hook-length control protein FliK [Mesorhizobium sp.]
MIDIATTPPPAAVPGAVAGGAGVPREGAPGFADLVTRQGLGRSSSARGGEGEGEAMSATEGGAEEPTGDRMAVQVPPDREEEAAGEDVPSWPAQGLHQGFHKVLSALLGDRWTGPRGDDEPSPEAVGKMLPERNVAPDEAAEMIEGDEAETDDDTGMPDDPEDAEAPAGTGAVAAAITLPAQPREHRPAGPGTTKSADRPAGADQLASPTFARQDEAAGGDDGARSGGERRGETAADAGKGRGIAPEAGDLKVRVIGETVTPPPGPLQNQRTIADLVATIASDGDWTSAMERVAASRSDAAGAPAGPVRDLRIQLNPAELGSVEARLRIVGEQLSVEIRVEGGEAFRRLSSERDAIVSALRGLGFAVDDVSIQQQSQTSAQAQTGAGGRQNDTSGGLSQGTGRDRQGEGEAAGGWRRGDEQGGQNGDALIPATHPAGGGLYI